MVRDNKNDSIGIVDLSMSTKLGIMVVVFESGSCWIIPLQKLSKNVATHNLSVNQTTYVSEYENVTCCDICDRFHFLALGLSTGNVIIYHLNLEIVQQAPIPDIHSNANVNKQNDKPKMNGNGGGNVNKGNNSEERKLHFRLEPLVIFSAHQYNLIPQTFALDDVRCVSWSDSGTSLAISWKKGVVVYSVRGIVVFSTLHHQIGDNDDEDGIYSGGRNGGNNSNNNIDYKKNKKKQKDDPVTTYYPSCLVWSQKDSGFIMVTHKHEVTGDDFNHLLKQYQVEKKLKQRRLSQQQQLNDINEESKVENDDVVVEEYKCKHDAYLVSISCLKHTLGNLSQSDVSKLALLGSSYISIWRPVHIIDDPESTDYWSRIEIESNYLYRNWPIRELAVNQKSDCFAIAGSTGFAIYYRKTARWKIVRSLDGENIIFTCVMCWLTSDLIFIATFDPTFRSSNIGISGSKKRSKWNLLCFDRWEIDKYFSSSSSGIPIIINDGFKPLFEFPLTNHPIGMEAVDTEKLLIYFVDGVIHVYDINIDNGKNSMHHKKNDNMYELKQYPVIELKNYCALAPFQTLSPHPVSLRIWNYGHYNNHKDKDSAENIIAMNANKDDAGFCILALDASRCLYKINPINNERKVITENVHDFYLMRETRDKNDKCYLWTYGKNNVKRWDIYYDINDSYKLKLKPLFVSPVQPHMTCIGICNTLNVLVYGRRIIRRAQPLYTPRFAIHIDIRSYLHVTIKEKLNSVGLDATFDFVLKAIAGGAWRCLNALENILRSSLQKRYKIKQRRKKKNQEIAISSSDDQLNNLMLNDDDLNEDSTMPFDKEAHVPLRTSYVFYPNDVERDFSRQNLNIQNEQKSQDLKHIPSKVVNDKKDSPKNNKKNLDAIDFAEDDVTNLPRNDEDEDDGSLDETLMMMSTISFDNDVDQQDDERKDNDNNRKFTFTRHGLTPIKTELKQMEEDEKEIDIVIKFLRKFPDYPGIVVNVARKTEPSQWNDLFKLCGSPVLLIQKSITRNQLATASKYLYVFEKIYIEYAIHFATLLLELAIESGSDNLVLSLLRFSHKLKLMIKESHENNIEIPQLNINID